MSGLIQELVVESDRPAALETVMRLCLSWHRHVSHYRTGVDMYGVPYLIFMWNTPSENGAEDSAKYTPLIAVMDNPEAIAHQVSAWLASQKYTREPDHDGGNNKGWRVTSSGPVLKIEEASWYNPDIHPLDHRFYIQRDHTFYDVFCVQPKWIEYAK